MSDPVTDVLGRIGLSPDDLTPELLEHARQHVYSPPLTKERAADMARAAGIAYWAGFANVLMRQASTESEAAQLIASEVAMPDPVTDAEVGESLGRRLTDLGLDSIPRP
jgi:hypothetical protein